MISNQNNEKSNNLETEDKVIKEGNRDDKGKKLIETQIKQQEKLKDLTDKFSNLKFKRKFLYSVIPIYKGKLIAKSP